MSLTSNDAESQQLVQFSRGLSRRLPADKVPGMFLLETDTGTMYCDDTEESRVQVKDPTKLPLTGGEITGDLSVSQTVTAQTFVGDFEGNATSATNADTVDGKHASDFSAVGHTHDDRYYTETEIDTKLSTKLDTSLKGAANGLAELDSDGRVPAAQLPSYVDDILEYTSISVFPTTGEEGKIYVDKTTNLTYRWSGTDYVIVSQSLALGETSSTAYAGDKGKNLATNLSSHVNNTEIHVTVEEKAVWNSKAELTDIPTTLPANGGNADTLDGKHADDFSQIINLGNTSTDTKTAIGIPGKTTTYWCSNWTGYPAEADGQGMIITVHYNGDGTVGVNEMWVRQLYITPHYNQKIWQRIIAGTTVGEWTNIADGGNADTVDGLHANGFIKVNSNSSYDCNTLYDTGLYLCGGSTTNTPNGLIYGTLLVMPYRKPYGNAKSDFCAQIFIPNGDVEDTSLWYRTSLVDSWNEWTRSCDGGNANTVDGKHASDFALKTDIPTSLPANGGNADTVDGKHASDFMPISGEARKYGIIRMDGSDAIYARHIDGNNTEFDGTLYLNYNNPNAPIYMNGSNTAIHSGNIGSQSVNYANSAGSAQPIFNNGTWYNVGDDVQIGDHNVAGGLGVLGANGHTRIDLCQSGNPSNYKSITFDGTTLNLEGNADTVDGVHINVVDDGNTGMWLACFPSHNEIRAISTSRAYVGNAGNADTVDGLHNWQHGTLDANGNSHGTGYPFYCKHNIFGDNRFGFYVDGYETRTHFATGADYAGGVSQAAVSNICLRNISAGTADLTAGSSPLATGTIYLVYE